MCACQPCITPCLQRVTLNLFIFCLYFRLLQHCLDYDAMVNDITDIWTFRKAASCLRTHQSVVITSKSFIQEKYHEHNQSDACQLSRLLTQSLLTQSCGFFMRSLACHSSVCRRRVGALARSPLDPPTVRRPAWPAAPVPINSHVWKISNSPKSSIGLVQESQDALSHHWTLSIYMYCSTEMPILQPTLSKKKI